MKISSDDSREEKNNLFNAKIEENNINKLNNSSLKNILNNYKRSSNSSNDIYLKSDNDNIINISVEILQSFFYEYQENNRNKFRENFNFNEIQIIKITTKVNDIKIINIEHEFNDNINSINYFCKLISKGWITKNLIVYEKKEINEFLNYNDNKICKIPINDNKKIIFDITLEDDKIDHCVFPIGLYEQKSKNQFIMVFSFFQL